MIRHAVSRPHRHLAFAVFALCSGLAPVFAQTPSSIFDEEPLAVTSTPIPDKIEGFNRTMFKFNDGLYRYTLRPISKGYAKVVPKIVRRGIGSFFHNLAFPTRFVGNVLEGKFDGAAVETGRFVVNTVSTLGFAQTANRFENLQERPSDLGLAFGSWGIGHGTYLILPLLGPTSVRDGIGQGISGMFLDPIDYVDEWEVETGAAILRVVNQSPEIMDQYDALKSAAIDPYVALRDGYSVMRANRRIAQSDAAISPVDAATNPTPETK